MQSRRDGFFFLTGAKYLSALHRTPLFGYVGDPANLPQERAKMAANAGREEKIYA
jgi:hypothetical protein